MKYRIAYIVSKLLDALFFRKSLPGIPVLMYHAIGDERSKLCVSSTELGRQMRFLASRGFRSILPHELAGAGPGERVFLITFDDGFKSVSETALPILEQYGFRAAVFAATDYVGKKSAYARSGQDRQFDMMDEDDLRLLAESGWCVANHFASHKNLAELSSTEVRKEYQQSREALERMGLGKYTDIVAYPFNRHSQKVTGVLRQAGVRMAFNGGNRLHTKSDDRLILPRIEVDGNLTKFKLTVSPSFNRIRQYVR